MTVMNDSTNETILKQICSGITYSRSSSLSQLLFERLKEAILTGTIPEGFSFPNENEMCRILDVGRSSLREAYTQLQLIGLITRTKNGTVVNDPDAFNSHVNLREIVDRTDMRNIIEFREIIETAIVSIASEKATAADVKNLREMLEAQNSAKDDSSQLTELDYRFHLALAGICGNPLLLSSLDSVQPKFKKAAYWVFSRQRQHNVRDHTAIVDAIEKHDVNAAREAMMNHLNSIRKVALSEN